MKKDKNLKVAIKNLDNKIFFTQNSNELSFKFLAFALNEAVFKSASFNILSSKISANIELKKLDLFHELLLNNHQVYSFKNFKISSREFNLFYLKNYKIDFLINIGTKNNFEFIEIYNKKFQNITSEYFEKINEIYTQQNNVEINEKNSVIELDIDEAINKFVSNEYILEDFDSIKPRYKTSLTFTSSSKLFKTITQRICEQLEIDNKNLILNKPSKWNFFKKIKTARVNEKFLKNHSARLFLNNEDQLDVWLKIDNKFKKYRQHDIATDYLYFLLDELKRLHKDISDLYVVLPIDVPFTIIEILNVYDVKYHLFNNNNEDLLNNKKCIFGYYDNKYISNPRFSTQPNNYLIILCLIWMLNSYINRNHMLTFKRQQIEQNFGKIIYKTKSFKFNEQKIQELSNKLVNDEKIKKTLNIANVVQLNKNQGIYLYLVKIQTVDKHTLFVKYSPLEQKIIFDLHLCEITENIDNNILLDSFKIQIAISKIIKKAKKSLK